MRLGSMNDPPSPSGRPDMGGSGSPTPSTTRPEVPAGGDPADAGALDRGSPALEGSAEASGRAGSRPLRPGGASCEVTGYVPTFAPTAAITASNSGPDPRQGVSMPFVSDRIAERNRAEPTHIKWEYGQR